MRKLSYTPTGPSRNPFRAFDTTRNETVFKGDRAKTQGPQWMRNPVMPSMADVANQHYVQRVPNVKTAEITMNNFLNGFADEVIHLQGMEKEAVRYARRLRYARSAGRKKKQWLEGPSSSDVDRRRKYHYGGKGESKLEKRLTKMERRDPAMEGLDVRRMMEMSGRGQLTLGTRNLSPFREEHLRQALATGPKLSRKAKRRVKAKKLGPEAAARRRQKSEEARARKGLTPSRKSQREARAAQPKTVAEKVQKTLRMQARRAAAAGQGAGSSTRAVVKNLRERLGLG